MANGNSSGNPYDRDGEESDERRGPPEFVHETRAEAEEAARGKAGKTKVSRKRVNGEQRWVVERREERRSTGASDLEVWRDDE